MNSPISTDVNNSEHSKFCFPSTPNLKRLGYGTGVGVFQVDRSPRNGLLSSPWALKKLIRSQCSDVAGKRLHAEANLLKKLNHPNIVGFRAFSMTNDGRGCLALEKCTTSLTDLIENREHMGPFPVEQIVKVAFEVAKALDYLHNTVYILHGDIKSQNVLIKGEFSEIKLCDFGVSLPLKPDGTFNRGYAEEATYVGTDLWAAPEVYKKTNGIIITDKADIFSYGLTLWEMLTLATPHLNTLEDNSQLSFSDETDTSIIEQELEKKLTDIIGTRPPLPDYISEDEIYGNVIQLFMKCTECDFKIRYSVKEVLNFLNKTFNISNTKEN